MGFRVIRMFSNAFCLFLLPVTMGDYSHCIFNCNFDNSTCNWTQDLTDNFNWTRYSGATDSLDTGPSCDHTSGGGHYMYIETSVSQAGRKARLISPFVNNIGEMCLVFYYHMYGSSINGLNVYLSRSGALGSLVWTRQGSQGNVWKDAAVSITGGWLTNIVLEGIFGNSYTGDIAVDDVSLIQGMCNEETCDFQSGMCGWNNLRTDKFDWQRGLSTGSNSCPTGPATDHTTGTRQGKYIFIGPSSARQQGDNAVLQSPMFQPRNGTCMTFYYYMFGPKTGTLSILVKPQNQNTSIVWSLTGHQGIMWEKGMVAIPQLTSRYQILLEVISGPSQTRSIAVDDILIVNQCPCTLTPQRASGSNIVQEPTSVRLQPDTDVIRVDEGSSLTVNCLPENGNVTITSVTWSHNGRNISGSQYYIQNVTQSDEGQLTCIAHGGGRTNLGRADTFIRVVLQTLEVRLEPNMDVIRVDDGNNLTVSCLSENASLTLTSITWSHKGQVSSGPTFYIQTVTESDEGRLTCRAENGVGRRPGLADTFIRVVKTPLVPTLVRLEPDTDLIRVVEGYNVTVHCLTNASVPSVMWSHNGDVSSGSTFHIQNVTKSDEGRLTCTAQSGIGTSPGQTDTFIVIMKETEEPSKAEKVVSEDDKSKWTMVHTAAVVAGVVALLIIVVLVMMIIFLYRKHGPVSMQKKWKSDDTERVTATKSYSHQEDSDSGYEKHTSALPAISKVKNKAKTSRERQHKMVAASNPVYDKDDDVVYDVPASPRTIQRAPTTQNKVTVSSGRPPGEEGETMEVYENFGTMRKAKDQALQVDKSVCEDLKREGQKKDTAYNPVFEEEESEEMYENFGTLERRKHQAEHVDDSEDDYQNFKDVTSRS